MEKLLRCGQRDEDPLSRSFGSREIFFLRQCSATFSSRLAQTYNAIGIRVSTEKSNSRREYIAEELLHHCRAMLCRADQHKHMIIVDIRVSAHWDCTYTANLDMHTRLMG